MGERCGSDRYTRTNGVRPSEAEIRSAAKLSRNTCTPDVALKLTEIWWETDIRGVLPAVQVPTLLMVAEGGGNNPEIAEYVASLMPNATSGWLRLLALKLRCGG